MNRLHPRWWGLLFSLSMVSFVFIRESGCGADLDFEPTIGDEQGTLLRAGIDNDSWPEFYWPEKLFPNKGDEDTDITLEDVIKEEVQRFNQELINFYREESLREKRSYSRYTYDIKLDPSNNFLETRISSLFAYPFTCHGKGFVIQSDGIYRLDGFTPEQHFYTENVTSPKLTKINNEWSIASGDQVFHVKEWEQKCFVLVSNQNGSFSSIYTLHGEDLSPVLWQSIRNKGVASSGKFFTIKRNLYLVIINDNAVHSLTICPVFRWAGTYMDEIHAIQTRGAVSVETFTINSKEYIAIAQSQDSSGNFEVGTQILSMDEKEHLEKVQLLWSNNPVALQYFQVLQEHYLLIGHAKEPSVIYVFGGLDFFPVQNLDNYFAPKLFLDSFLLPHDKGPLLLAAKSSSLHFYTWSTTSGSLVLNSNSSAVAIKYPTRIVSAKFIRPASSQTFLTLVQTDKSNVAVLKVYSVVLEKKEIAESQVKETESQLARCLGDVRKRLDEDEKLLPILEHETNTVLTVDGDHVFAGTIHVSDSAQVNESVTNIASIDVIPEGFEYREPLTTPSVLLENILDESRKLKSDILDELPNILMSNKPGVISGDYTFLTQLEAKEIVAPYTTFEMEMLNDIPLSDIHEYALKKDAKEPQHITGEWTLNKLSVSEVFVPSHISDVEVDGFLLKKCPNRNVEEEAQDVDGHVVFKEDVKIPDGIVMPADAFVNGIKISDLVLKNSPIKSIKGFKHANNLIGGEGFTFSFINDKNFTEWYESVLHTDGPPQSSTGIKTLAGSKPNKIANLNPEFLNGYNWETFYKTVLRNIGDQEIEGDFQFEKLDVDALDADSVVGVSFSELLSGSSTQHIHSNITAGTLTVQRNFNLETGLINGIPLVESAVQKNENATITGPVELENFKVSGDVTIEESATIEGKDISEIAKLKRTQVYYTPRNQTILFKAPLIVDNLETRALNGHTLESLQNNFWSSKGNNVIEGPLDLRGRKVRVLSDYMTGTLNGLHLEEDLVRVDDREPISAKLNFLGDVIVVGNVHQVDGKTLNGKDFSELAQNIVRTGDGRKITGKKVFKSRVNAEAGAEISSLNGIRIPEDLVFLDSPDNQFVGGLKAFKHNVNIDTLITSVDIEVGGKVNEIDMMELDKTTAYKDGQILIHGNVIFNASFSASHLHVVHKLDGVNVTDLLRNVIYLDEEQTIKFPVKVLNGDVIVERHSFVKSINGIVLNDYLSRVVASRDFSPDYRINGTKTFVNLLVDGDLLCDTFNGISLKDLKTHAFSLTQPQNVTGKFTFETLTVDDNLDVRAIGGVKSDDLIFINDPQTCSTNSDITFLGDVIVTGPLQIDGLLNGHSSEYISEGHEGGYHDRDFSEIEVHGDLTWENDREDIQGISHFLENAVTLDTDQEITGPVVFVQGFYAEVLEARPWINNVDLERIQEDALHIGDDPWELEGNNTFLKGLVISEPSLSVQRLNAHKVHGIDLKAELNKIVWKNSHGLVYGVKYFPNGLDVDSLKFKDLNRKGDYTWLVTNSDNRTIDHMELNDLKVADDLNFNKSKGFDLQRLLSNRVTRDGDEILTGNFTIPSLVVQNSGCNVEYINGINVVDIFFNNGTGKQVIGGKKTFKNGVTVSGNLYSPDINGYNLATMGKDVYRTNKNEVINRPFVVAQPVVIQDSLEIGYDINSHRIEELKQKISHAIKGIESRALENPKYKPSAEKLNQILEMKEDLPASPFWLEYLRLKQSWDYLGPHTRVEFTETSTGGIVSLYNSEDVDLNVSGLSNGCQCTSVQMVEIDGPSIVAEKSNYFRCLNAFVVTSSLNNVYSVTDDSLSYNKSCNPLNNARLVITNNTESGQVFLNVSSYGHLSDVKAFSVYGKDYLVLAYFFDAVKDTHDAFTLVYRVNPKNLTLVQSIPCSGPTRLALTSLKSEWILAIANNRDPKTDSCLTNSGIYRWSSTTHTFNLLRDVKTNGAVDVTFLDVEDRGAHYKKGELLSFVAFAQNGNSGDGEVMVLQYDPVKGNYLTVQSLRTVWSVTGMDYVCVQENCYLITVVPQEGIHFHEYRYVEGFQKALSIPLLGASDITLFSWGENHERILFSIASTKGSLLAEGVIAGNTIPEYIEEGNYSGYESPYDNTPIILKLQD